MPQFVLATGGAGYVGSHVVSELLAAGRPVLVLDNFSNSTPQAIANIAALGHGAPDLVEGDVRDAALLESLFARYDIAAVVHLAGAKSVSQSVRDPLHYYDVNVGGAISLLQAMLRHRVHRLVFSSSATVYGNPETLPVREDAPTAALNPYGRTKLLIERLIDDVAAATPEFAAISLRYFNPVGAHPSALLGENPRDAPDNLFPYVAQTAIGLRDRVRIFGNDYPTPDGTGVRDYLHVVDLALGHVAAVDRLLDGDWRPGRNVPINLGRGRGYSVLEAIEAFARAAGRAVPYEIVARRPGDIATCVADPGRAAELLGWKAVRGMDAMCADHWAFQSRTLATDRLARRLPDPPGRPDPVAAAVPPRTGRSGNRPGRALSAPSVQYS